MENRILITDSNEPALNIYLEGLYTFYNSELSIGCFGETDGITPPDEKCTMWAHFGGKHSGACFIFDKNKLINEVEKKTRDYEKDMIVYNLDKLFLSSNNQFLNKPYKEFLKDSKSSILFKKHVDWNCEKEFRIVVFEVTFEIPILSCLQEVAFGPEMDLEIEEACIILINKHFNSEIKYGRMGYSGSGYLRPFRFFPK